MPQAGKMAIAAEQRDEVAGVHPTPDVATILRKVRAHAAAGQWPQVLSALPSNVPDSGHYVLAVERLRAALELNDSEQVGICTEAAPTFSSDAERIHFASLLVNGNCPLHAWQIVQSLETGRDSIKVYKIVRRIMAASSDPDLRSNLKKYIKDYAIPAKNTEDRIEHRFPSDSGQADKLPSTLTVVRLPGVPEEIESRIRELWSRFDLKLAKDPSPAVREYKNVFVNEFGQMWTEEGVAIKTAGRPIPNAVSPSSVTNFQAAFSCVREVRGYYEWLVDLLGSLGWRLSPESPDCPILMRREQYGFAVDALTPLGVDKEKIVEVTGTVFCQKLYVGSSSSAALTRMSAYQHSYGRLKDVAATQGRSDTPKQFYISRRDSSRRSMTNEAEFEAAIAERGFAPVVLSQLGLLEKINLFRNADVVIGAHGAGFSHLLFAKPGLRVVEMIPVTMNQFSQMGYRVCFTLLSKVFGLNHTVVLHPMNPANAEWSADADQIVALV